MTRRSIPADEVRFFSGSSNLQLAERIATEVGAPLDAAQIGRFSNDNLYIQLGASMRYRRVYIVQSLSTPVNDHLMELLMMLNIARSSAASEVTAIIPYYSFARSDKKNAPRVSIDARLVADLLKTAGATHVISMTLHSPQVEGFFSIPIDALSSRAVFNKYLSDSDLSNSIIIASNLDQTRPAVRLANALNVPVAASTMERDSDNRTTTTGLIGNQLRGYKRALIYADEIATSGSTLALSEMLIKEGVEEIRILCTHGVFVRGAIEKLAAIPQITEVITTNTVYIPSEKRHPKLTVLSVAGVFADAIRYNFNQESIADLFVFGGESVEALHGSSTTEAPPPLMEKIKTILKNKKQKAKKK
ncbi:MAG TPA: ribose-phosphate pyrophosphokinase [Anaerolineales bacterium]|nr:ribose-phosphate pyrophosphokinase [Anaerolineales bacterium]